MIYATTVEEAAKYIVLFLREKEVAPARITDFRVLKLLYAVYAWTLVSSDNKISLCEEPPQAWKLGPVFASLWRNSKVTEWVEDSNLSSSITDSPIEKVFQKTLNLYYKVPENKLFILFHDDPAWKKQRQNLSVFDKSSNYLDNNDIYAYYSSLREEVTPYV